MTRRTRTARPGGADHGRPRPHRPALARWLRLLVPLEALAHELPALVLVKVLRRRLLVAGLHLLGLTAVAGVRRLVRARRLRRPGRVVARGGSLQTLGHELLAGVTGELPVARLRGALRRPRARRRGLLLICARRGNVCEEREGCERSKQCVHDLLLSMIDAGALRGSRPDVTICAR